MCALCLRASARACEQVLRTVASLSFLYVFVCMCVCVCVCVRACVPLSVCLSVCARERVSSGVVRDAEVLDRIYNPKGKRRAKESQGPEAAHAQDGGDVSQSRGDMRSGALTEASEWNRDSVPLSQRQEPSAVVVGTPGAENPKYRQDALRRSELCRKEQGGGGGGIVVSSREVREGLRVDLWADLNEGHVTSLLLDTSSATDRVIGHVVANDAGTSDEDLDQTLDTLFPHAAKSATVSQDGTSAGGAPGTLMQVASNVLSAGKARGGENGRGDRRIVGLVSIVVDQDVRQQGLGRLLMSETMSFYHQVGFDYVLLQQRDIGTGRSAVCATCTRMRVRRRACSGGMLDFLLRILCVRVPFVCGCTGV